MGVAQLEVVLLGLKVIPELLVQLAPGREVRKVGKVPLVGDFIE